MKTTDYLVIGSGLAGLAFALKAAEFSDVTILCKGEAPQTNSALAQGGIAAVQDPHDNFANHIQDTLTAGAGLCRESIVRMVVEQAPDRVDDLIQWGVHFDEGLNREGGHNQRRIVHVQDHTGAAVHQALLAKARAHSRIHILENQFAVDLITTRKVDPHSTLPNRCLGAYVLNEKTGEVESFLAKATLLATGGIGKVYLYTSNWHGSTGDGLAMAFRAGARVGNLEFMQFHPTCLYHPQARNFLITEAMRGDGGELINARGEAFMKKYHPLGSLAPRDIVARCIDFEMKLTAADSVFLDVTKIAESELLTKFPVIMAQCRSLGIDPAREPIPVVPAAHYLCGGVLTNENSLTDIAGLFALGETAWTGLHGANRLASNSLLECLVTSHNAALFLRSHDLGAPKYQVPDWIYSHTENADELVVISHMWDEIRRLMWNYVGIVRSNRRLARAQARLRNIQHEVQEYYWNFKLHRNLLELRNIALAADLSVRCALQRKESRGIHYNIDYPETSAQAVDTIVSPISWEVTSLIYTIEN